MNFYSVAAIRNRPSWYVSILPPHPQLPFVPRQWWTFSLKEFQRATNSILSSTPAWSAATRAGCWDRGLQLSLFLFLTLFGPLMFKLSSCGRASNLPDENNPFKRFSKPFLSWLRVSGRRRLIGSYFEIRRDWIHTWLTLLSCCLKREMHPWWDVTSLVVKQRVNDLARLSIGLCAFSVATKARFLSPHPHGKWVVSINSLSQVPCWRWGIF